MDAHGGRHGVNGDGQGVRPPVNTRLRHVLESLRGTLWFVPSACVLVSILLSFLAAWIDRTLPDGSLDSFAEYVPRSIESVRTLFATIGTSMLGVAGVSFSITIVALSLASSQFGPRLLRNFIRDTRHQTVLGIQLGVFVYCLFQLGLLPERDPLAFEAPVAGATVALAATLAGLGSFIYFIHTITTSMQAERVIQNVFVELRSRILEFFPADETDVPGYDPEGWESRQEDSGEPSQTVRANGTGYIQAYDIERLRSMAEAEGVTAVCLHHPGKFLGEGLPALRILGGDGLEDDALDRFATTCLIGPGRTVEQDFEFAIHQLVEVAVRALSPGVNDPFTAITCIDYLGAAYTLIGSRRLPGNRWDGGDGRPVLLTPPVTYRQILDAGMNQIRQNIRDDMAVTIRVLDMFLELARGTSREDLRDAIRQQAEAIHGGSSSGPLADQDRHALDGRYEGLLALLESAPKTKTGH